MKNMKNQKTHGFRRVLAVALGVIALMAVEQRAEAQQFSTGVSLNVVRQPGYANWNLAQQQYLLALKQRQHAISNYGTAVNLQAARVNAYRKQIESARRAQFAQMQAQLHYQNAMRLRAAQQKQAYWNYVNGRR
jgi:hypothetical protein